MPRPRMRRRVCGEPNFTFFKPAGTPRRNVQEIQLTIDEMEAVRLSDFLEIPQDQAAEKMNISQPTFHRLILSARKKIADFLINGKSLKIYGGNYFLDKNEKL